MRLVIPESVQRRPWLGFGGSLVLHLLLVASLVWVHAPSSRLDVKRGEPLFVELPNADEAAMRGLPGPPAPSTPEPPAPPAVKPAPPPPPAPKPVRPARPAVKRPPAVAKTPSPQPPAPPVVAKAPAPAPEPPKAEEPAPEPAPAKPAPPVEAPASAAVPETPPVDTPPRPAVAADPPRVASTTGPRAPAAPDIRSALGRSGQGGAGGSGVGRAGIEGEPIPLESKDPNYSDYLNQVRRMIKEKWAYPCVRDPGSGRCDYKNAQLVVEFGIRKDGPVAFVIVRKQSDFDVYDEYAVNAIKLASPFPPVPDSMTKGHKAGIPIVATFSYLVESSLTNLLR